MKRTFIPALALLGLSLLASSCSRKEESVNEAGLVTHNDFESVLGWGGNAEASISANRAHSGKYAVKVGPQNEFGYTYIQTLGKMSTAKMKTLTVSAWVWVPSAQAKSQFVVSISRSPELNTPVFYGSVELPTVVDKMKSWQHVSHTFTLPDSVRETNMLKCYLWKANSAEDVFADDISLNVNQ